MTYESVAIKLQLTPEELERKSLRLFLIHRLRSLETQMLEFSRKYGVKTVVELDELVQSGKLHESETYEDYFEMDHLEAERDITLELLKNTER